MKLPVTRTLLLLAVLAAFASVASAEPPPRLKYDAAKIAADPKSGWLDDLQPYKRDLAACFGGDIASFLKLEEIAPGGDGESQDSRLLWLVMHIWGDAKFARFLAAQPERYRALTSRTLRWTHDEGGWHDLIDNDLMESYLTIHFPDTWRVIAEFPKPESNTPQP